jgi:hypothetical protein
MPHRGPPFRTRKDERPERVDRPQADRDGPVISKEALLAVALLGSLSLLVMVLLERLLRAH